MSRWIQILLAVAVFVLVAWFLDLSALAQQVEQLSLWTVAAAILMVYCMYPPLIQRWILLLRPIAAPVNGRRIILIYLYAAFLNSFSPATVAGDLYRTLAHRAETGGVMDIVALLLRERLFGLLTFCGISLAAVVAMSLSAGGLHSAFIVAGMICAAVIVAVLLARPLIAVARSLAEKAKRKGALLFLDKCALAASFRFDRSFFAALLLGLASYAMWLTAVVIVARDIGIELGIVTLMAVSALSQIIRLLPLTFQGVGVRESAFSAFIGAADGDPAAGFVLGTVVYAIMTLTVLSFGLIGPQRYTRTSDEPRTTRIGDRQID